ncbi:hypothetical protein C1H46_012878 [Malus baccata]|uniref:PGG domain-containing protein n=1 Tax=Malus baccata TaxID=106549 RepID=A0A540MRU1_MALBA|nr:hypothetical protein C1H46_012878 [Malus baccata]
MDEVLTVADATMSSSPSTVVSIPSNLALYIAFLARALTQFLKLFTSCFHSLAQEISDDHTNNNPTTVDAELEEWSAIDSASLAGHEDNHVNQTLLNLVKKKDWDAAMEFLIQHPKAVTARIRDGGTILHLAVIYKKVDIAKKLVHLMRPKDLEIQDYVGLTALHLVITDIPESVELAKCMVEKNNQLLRIVYPPEQTVAPLAGKITPLFEAYGLSQEGEMAKYLYSVTPHETLKDSECAMLITEGFRLKRFDIQIKPMTTIEKPIPTTHDDVCINVEKPGDGDQSNKRQRHLICSDDQRNWSWFVSRKDKSGNNMLHMVGTISSAAQINLIRGAALQMQRELQWLKEVERFAQPVDHEVINKTDEMTPRELFTKGHKDLVKEGEKAMKDTATSCTVVGALIVTIMFAAAFTVPGGNKQDTGLPIFLIMIFLGILTSRYAEDDFFKSLPTKMISGLITLFLSIAAMMIAFSSALSIMLHGKSSITILICLLASVPIASFIWIQFPLLRELVISTYGAGVFDKKIKNWPEEDPKYSASC